MHAFIAHVVRSLPLIVLLSAGSALPAHAAQDYDNCTGFIDSLPATITTQGTWCLRRDLATAMTSGNAITISANNVTLDCNHFKLGGLAAGSGTETRGIQASSRLNLTVRNCNIRGFHYGIATLLGGGHLIERNSFDGNTYTATEVHSPSSTIRANRMIDTGGSTVISFAYGIRASQGVDIIDNTIAGVVAGTGDSSAFGIRSDSNSDGSIIANRIRGLVASGLGSTTGIHATHQSDRLIVRDNDLQGNGLASSFGVRCTSNQGTANGNVISGFATGIENCTASGNTINTN